MRTKMRTACLSLPQRGLSCWVCVTSAFTRGAAHSFFSSSACVAELIFQRGSKTSADQQHRGGSFPKRDSITKINKGWLCSDWAKCTVVVVGSLRSLSALKGLSPWNWRAELSDRKHFKRRRLLLEHAPIITSICVPPFFSMEGSFYEYLPTCIARSSPLCFTLMRLHVLLSGTFPVQPQSPKAGCWMIPVEQKEDRIPCSRAGGRGKH